MKTLSLITMASIVALSFSTVAFAEDKKHSKRMSGGHHMMAKKMDTNKDGSVSREEFQAHQNKRFAGVDGNNDKSLTLEEFAAHAEKMKEERKKAIEKAKQARMKKMFDALDANGDGKVSQAEFDAKGDRTFIRMDNNDDGVLNKDDHKRKMMQRHKRHGKAKMDRMHKKDGDK